MHEVWQKNHCFGLSHNALSIAWINNYIRLAAMKVSTTDRIVCKLIGKKYSHQNNNLKQIK